MNLVDCGYSNMRIEVRLFLALVRESIEAGHQTEVSNILAKNKIDWVLFKEIFSYHELATFIYNPLKQSIAKIPIEITECLKNSYYFNFVRCNNYWQEFLRISDTFNKAEIIILPIKGVAFLADIYAQKPIRPMVDIDLLVKEEDIDKAISILLTLGYKKELRGVSEEYWRNDQYHLPFYNAENKSLPSVELHWALDYKRQGRYILPEIWDRIREIDIDGKKIKLLSYEDTLFSLVLHNRRLGKTLCLKSIYDLAALLKKHKDSFDWEYILKQSIKYRIRATLFFSFCQVNLVLPLIIPGFIIKELKIPCFKGWMIKQFIGKNTFLPQVSQNKSLFSKSHFLIYDNVWEPINYIVNIPLEQFAKYYNLKPYEFKTKLFYRIRFLYMLANALMRFFHK